MKKGKRWLALAISICMIGGLTASMASATSITTGVGLTVHNNNETANYSFDGKTNGTNTPQIRCVTTATCSPVPNAVVRYQLHRAYSNIVMKDTQYYKVGAEVKPWWFAEAGKYHVDFKAEDNHNNKGKTQPIYLSKQTIQNFIFGT